MELQGVQEITNALNAWLEKHGFTARADGLCTDFGYWIDKDTIDYSLTTTEKIRDSWNSWIEEVGCEYVIDFFYSAFLHELGHSETIDQLTDEEWEISSAALLDPSITYCEYYHLPRELAATQWAVDYINNHTREVTELIHTVEPALVNFVQLNNIEN